MRRRSHGWFSQPVALHPGVGTGTKDGNTLTSTVPSDLNSVPTDSVPVHADLAPVHSDLVAVHTESTPVSLFNVFGERRAWP